MIAGTSSQNRMNIAANDMETIPTINIAMIRTIVLPKLPYYPQYSGVFSFMRFRISKNSFIELELLVFYLYSLLPHQPKKI